MENVTITYMELELDVEFDYQPAEKAVMYYGDGSGYPGCEASVDICLIECGGIDLTEYFVDDSDDIIELVFEELESYCDYEP